MARTMKDSGVEWIGQIPKEWGVVPVKRKYKNAKEIVGAREPDFQRLALTMNGIVKRSKESADGLQPEKFNTYQIVYNQELLFKLIDLENVRTSRIGRSQYTGIVSPVYIRLINPQESSYGFYFFTNLWHQEVFNYLGSGVRSSLNATDLLKMPYLHVPEEEQRKIVEFLDEKTTHIDGIIVKTKESIEAFKEYKQALITETVTKGLNPNVRMKNSGIEWMGEIPEHCNLKKVKTVTSKIGSGKTPRGGASVYSDEGVLFLRSQNVYDTGLYLEEATYISEEIDEAMKSTRVYPNDVLLNITGASIGRCCVYPENLKNHANVNQHVCIIRPILNKITPQFLFYFFNSHAGQSAINYYQTGGNREGLNFEQIANIRIPYYSISEQQQITDFLDEKCAHIDSLIAYKEKLIKEFENYKRAPSYEYITGEKEVE